VCCLVLTPFSFFFCSCHIPRPPRPTLFPYTTLFRSCAGRTRGHRDEGSQGRRFHRRLGHPPHARRSLPPRQRSREGRCRRRQPRSEEHTSELQSRENLVCRLLLEKKKKDQKNKKIRP